MTLKIYEELEQGSDEWLAARCGILTASEMKLIVTPKLKVAGGEKVKTHMYELAAQRLSKYVEPMYISNDMIRGMEDEIVAKALYEETYKREVKEVGFITNDNFGYTLGYSPDGLVGKDGLIEIKSRVQKYQFKTIAEDTVPDEYMMQLQTGLLITGRKWIDFISYSAGMPMFVQRVKPDAEYHDAIKEASKLFHAQMSEHLFKYDKNCEVHKFVSTERKEEDL